MQYFFTVHGRRDINAYDSDEEMHAAFERIGRFNQKLQDEGHWAVSYTHLTLPTILRV